MKTKVIKWIGEQRTIPKYGVVTKGSLIKLPAKLADSFIEQKLAVANKVAKETRK